MPANNNSEVIINALNEAISKPTPALVKQSLMAISKELGSYLEQLNKFFVDLESNSESIINQYRQNNASDNTITYALFKQLNYSDAKIKELLTTGLTIVERIRQFFTNETITYRIGYKYRGNLYEATFTLEEILQYSSITFNTRSKIENVFKLRLTDRRGIREALQKAENVVVTAVNDGSTVFSKVWHYVNAPADSKNKNLGNAYEVYRRIVAERQGSNRIPPDDVDTERISNVFNLIRSNTASFVKGGDYVTEQIKFFGNAPSLVTTNTIRTTLTEVKLYIDNFIQSGNNAELESSIKNLFIKDSAKVVDEIEKNAIAEAEKYLHEVIVKFNINNQS